MRPSAPRRLQRPVLAALMAGGGALALACNAQKARAPERARSTPSLVPQTAPSAAAAPKTADCAMQSCAPTPRPDVYERLFDLPCQYTAEVGIVNARCLGAHGDGKTDDTAALENALALAVGNRAVLLLPAGDYLIGRTLRLDGNRSLIGSPPALGRARIVVAASVTEPLPVAVVSNGLNTIANLTIDANFRAKLGLHLFKNHGLRSEIRNVRVAHALEDGLLCDFSMSSTIEQVTSERNGRHGFRFNSCNGELVTDLQARDNEGAGVVVSAAPSSIGAVASGGVHLLRGVIRGNRGPAISIEGTTSFTVVESFAIETERDGVVVSDNARLFALRANRIRGVRGKTAAGSRAIRVTSGAFNGFVLENVVEPLKGAPNFARIELEAAVTDTYVIGNREAGGARFKPVTVAYESRNVVALMPHHEFLRGSDGQSGAQNLPTLSFAASPALAGQSSPGDVVINPRPTIGQDMGWVCTGITATGCSWRALRGN
jgi:hypothetical protein